MAQVTKKDARPSKPSTACCGGLSEMLSPKLFKALSDSKRLSLLARLAEEGGPRTVSQLAEGSGVDLSVVSRHLAILRNAGIIDCVKHGKELWCTVQTNAVAEVLRNLADAMEACCPEGDCPQERARRSSGTRPGGVAVNRLRASQTKSP
jgi:DNA-binding transcriptional ArsR family regulator